MCHEHQCVMQAIKQIVDPPCIARAALIKAVSVFSLAQGATTAKLRRERDSLQQRSAAPSLNTATRPAHANRTATFRRSQSPSRQGGIAEQRLSRSRTPSPRRLAAQQSFTKSQTPSQGAQPSSASSKNTALFRRAATAAHTHLSEQLSNTMSLSTSSQVPAMVQTANAISDSNADELLTEHQSALASYDGSLDSHLHMRPTTAPEERWQTAATASGFDLGTGTFGRIQQQPLAALPGKVSDDGGVMNSQAELQLKEALGFAQAELTDSAESSAAASPRPVSHAVDLVPRLRARTAISSPGSSLWSTPRTCFLSGKVHLTAADGEAQEQENGSCAKQRLLKLSLQRAVHHQPHTGASRVCVLAWHATLNADHIL